MTAFSATDAALEGFRITRERPRALMAWTVFSFLVSVAGALISLFMPQDVREAQARLASPEPLEAAALGETLLVLAPLLLFSLAVQSIMAAAVYRIMLRREPGWFGYLKLGRDELRLMALTVIYILAFMVLVSLTMVGVALVMSLAGLLGEGAAVFTGMAAALFALGLLIYVLVRMSLAPVITFDQERLALLDSWSFTRGQVWRLLGAYVLALCSIFVVAMLAMVLFGTVAGAILLSTGGSLSDLGAILQPQQPTLESYFNPFVIAYLLMGSLFAAIYYAVMAAPAAFAYRALAKGGA